MNPIRSVFFPSRFRAAAALLVLLAATGEARAAKKVVADITTNARFALYYTNGANDGGFAPADQDLLDDNLETGFDDANAGECFIADFSEFLTSDEPAVYVDRIEIGRLEERTYSLYVATDNVSTNAEDWTAVAENVRDSGMKTYHIKERIKAVKYVFVTTTGNNDLGEFHVYGFRSSVPKKVSNYTIATYYNPNGTVNADAFGGGDNSGANTKKRLFDGNFTTYWPWPRAGVGSSVVVDFTKNDGTTDLKEYFVTTILVGSSGDLKFSLQYSTDGGTNWLDVAKSVKQAGISTWNVNASAKQVRYVFDEVNWGYSMANGYLAEIEVWGMNPDDVPCMHDNIDSVDWTPVEGSATCTQQGMDERYCPDCGERFEKVSDDPPLGHDYITTLDRPGAYKKFGSGSISCSRCDFFLPCTNVYEQASTNGPVDLIRWGGPAVENLVQFTDFSVSSSDHPQWGPNMRNVIDNNWNWAWCTYWVSEGWNDQHVDFKFGTTIDLAWIDICVHNHEDCNMMFYDVDDDTDEETLLGVFVAPYIPDETHHEGVTEVVFSETEDAVPSAGKTYYTIRPDSDNNNAPTYYPSANISAFSPEETYYEKSMSANRYYTFENAAARVQYVDKTERYMYNDNPTKFTVATQYYIANGITQGDDLPILVDHRTYHTRTTCRFFKTPCKHLRLRMEEETGYRLWSGHSMCIVEMRPWGTVLGAGDTPYRKETLMIFR